MITQEELKQYLTEHPEKEAELQKLSVSLSNINPTALKVTALLAGAATLPIIGIAASDAYDAIRRGITKGRDYKRMMEVNPHLAEADPVDRQRVFSTLHRFAPDLAKDPLVAGAVVKNFLEYPGGSLPLQAVAQLISAQKGIGAPTYAPDYKTVLDTYKASKETGRSQQRR